MQIREPFDNPPCGLSIIQDINRDMSVDISIAQRKIGLRTRALTSAHARAPRTASSVIGNLLVSTGGTLMAASELAQLTGHSAIADHIEEIRSYICRLAAKVDGIGESELDWVTSGTALYGPIDAEALAKASRSPAFQLYLDRRIRQKLPDLGRSEASLLILLLEQPGVFVSKRAIHVALKTRSSSASVVKVYISKIRKSLYAIGLTNSIETGKMSYKISDESAQLIINFLHLSDI